MLVLMKVGATAEEIQTVVDIIKKRGVEPLVLPGEPRKAVGIPGSLSHDERIDLESVLGRLEFVSKITQTSSPFKLASLEFHPQKTVVTVKGTTIGPGHFVVMGGPCSVESYEQFKAAAEIVKSAGATVLRGGAFKPRTSPYSFQGLQQAGLEIIRQVSIETGLATITEVMSADLVETVAEHVDILQIGARSMQNFPLLIEAGKSGKPVFLKRGPSATIDEWLLASEYILNQGNPNVILCERGVIPVDRTYSRNTLDLNAVPAVKSLSHLPIIVDPSHGTGVAKFVSPLAKASLMAGADGVMIEMHPDPREALSDGSQALEPTEFTNLVNELRKLAEFSGIKM
ncbi:3-deoxy-7-phosphoheptulonate synthase [Kamptonema cortianum]|nr:3-deoxy-7-phosphoheptulonate synthase [Geitlerinema splendidum]MDK3161029.1 3-deoxy-7-phosphoheptulonate synthase [Kamptonema cortianum]